MAESTEVATRFERGTLVAKLSTAAMVFLTVIKGYVGLVYGSVALVADALNSLSDILASALIWSGLVMVSRPPNERFPYGYYRVESIATLLVSLMIAASGVEIVIQAVHRLLNPQPLVDAGVPLVAAAISMFTYYILSVYKKRVGRDIGSSSLVADSTHSMVDVYAGLLVFVGIVFSSMKMSIVEILVAFGLGVYVILQGADFAKGAVLALMDAGVRPEVVDEVKRIAGQIDGVVDVHDVRVRYAGPVCFAEMHLTVTRDLTIDEAHEIADIVEERLRERIPEMETVTIHTEPDGRVRKRLGVPVDGGEDLNATVSHHFSKAPRFVIVEVGPEGVRSTQPIDNPAVTMEKRRGVTTANVLTQKHVTAIVVDRIGEGPFDILQGRHIVIYALPEGATTVGQVVEAYLEGRLKRLRSPTQTHDQQVPHEGE